MSPRHNGFIPIKIKGHTITEHVAYFISHQDSTKGKDPNKNIIYGIHNIKGKTAVNILASNYTNKHIMLTKGEYVEHLEPTFEDIEEEKNQQVEPDIFKQPHHKLKQHIEAKLEALLKEYASQFAQD